MKTYVLAAGDATPVAGSEPGLFAISLEKVPEIGPGDRVVIGEAEFFVGQVGTEVLVEKA